MGNWRNGTYFESLRMHHFQFMAVAVVVCFTSSLLMPSRRPSPSALHVSLHLFMFAANFGAQLWVTLVAGLTMFYSLPRHMFGQVQSRLFPMFFLWSLVCSAVTLSTYLAHRPLDTWETQHWVQGLALATCFLTAGVNSLILSPVIVAAMLKTFKMEVDAGVADVIGYADLKELKKNPQYSANYRLFRRCHGLSAMMVVLSLVANSVYLYYVASLLVSLQSPV